MNKTFDKVIVGVETTGTGDFSVWTNEGGVNGAKIPKAAAGWVAEQLAEGALKNKSRQMSANETIFEHSNTMLESVIRFAALGMYTAICSKVDLKQLDPAVHGVVAKTFGTLQSALDQETKLYDICRAMLYLHVIQPDSPKVLVVCLNQARRFVTFLTGMEV